MLVPHGLFPFVCSCNIFFLFFVSSKPLHHLYGTMECGKEPFIKPLLDPKSWIDQSVSLLCSVSSLVMVFMFFSIILMLFIFLCAEHFDVLFYELRA